MKKDIDKKFLMKDRIDWYNNIYAYYFDEKTQKSYVDICLDMILRHQKFKKMNFSDDIDLKNLMVVDGMMCSNKYYDLLESNKMKVYVEGDDARILPFNMVYCPKGIFKNASNKEQVIEKPFFIGETEVTQELYELVIGDNPSVFQDKEKYPNASKHPVENITWYDAVYFCNQLSLKHGLNEYYLIIDRDDSYSTEGILQKANVFISENANGYRLPNTLEFVYATRAGTNNRYAGTNDPKERNDFGWFDIDRTHEVATKKPNDWGIYDMNGNGEEFLQEVASYDKDGNLEVEGTTREKTNTSVNDPQYPAHIKLDTGDHNVVLCRGANKHSKKGFRLAIG